MTESACFPFPPLCATDSNNSFSLVSWVGQSDAAAEAIVAAATSLHACLLARLPATLTYGRTVQQRKQKDWSLAWVAPWAGQLVADGEGGGREGEGEEEEEVFLNRRDALQRLN
jgi:hypothetical protein